MSPSVLVDPAVVVEARATRLYYLRRSPSAAAKFIAELDLAMEAIATKPDSWPRYVDDTRRYVFRRFPFFLVYRTSPDGTHIIALVHGRRRPGYWRNP